MSGAAKGGAQALTVVERTVFICKEGKIGHESRIRVGMQGSWGRLWGRDWWKSRSDSPSGSLASKAGRPGREKRGRREMGVLASAKLGPGPLELQA